MAGVAIASIVTAAASQIGRLGKPAPPPVNTNVESLIDNIDIIPTDDGYSVKDEDVN
jgi:hypothetical protein